MQIKDEIVELIKLIDCPPFKIDIFNITNDVLSLWISHSVYCINTGEPLTIGGPLYINTSEVKHEVDLCRAIRNKLIEFSTHEIDEAFKLNKYTLFNPHKAEGKTNAQG